MFWVLQFLLTILMIIFIKSTAVKFFALVVFWYFTFNFTNKKLTLIDLKFTALFSLIFTVANFGALKNNVFQFSQPDILLMPYNELLMWGFYCLNAHKFLGSSKQPTNNALPTYILTFVFSVSFSAIKNEIILAIVGVLIFIVALAYLRFSKHVLLYTLYFGFMGLVVETYGVHLNFWHYPHAEYASWPLWGPFMWLNIGWIMSQMSSLFYRSHFASHSQIKI